jgi:hypothetical protein
MHKDKTVVGAPGLSSINTLLTTLAPKERCRNNGKRKPEDHKLM